MFSKPNALVYFRRSGLLVTGKGLETARLTFDPEQIDDLEILRPDSFLDSCADFFQNSGLRAKRVLVVLDASLVFAKTFRLDGTATPKALQQTLMAAMPYDEGKRACLSLRTTEELRLFVTNAELYMAISEALRSAGAKVLHIVPLQAYSLGPDEQKLSAAVPVFMSDTAVRGKADFRSVHPA